MTDVTCVIQAVVASAVGGGAVGTLIGMLIQHREDRKEFALRQHEKNELRRENANLRRQLSERNAQDKPAAAPTTNNDWMRETIQLPTAEADR